MIRSSACQLWRADPAMPASTVLSAATYTTQWDMILVLNLRGPCEESSIRSEQRYCARTLRSGQITPRVTDCNNRNCGTGVTEGLDVLTQ